MPIQIPTLTGRVRRNVRPSEPDADWLSRREFWSLVFVAGLLFSPWLVGIVAIFNFLRT